MRRFWLRGRGLDVELAGQLQLALQEGAPTVVGELGPVGGVLVVLGRTFQGRSPSDQEKRGWTRLANQRALWQNNRTPAAGKHGIARLTRNAQCKRSDEH